MRPNRRETTSERQPTPRRCSATSIVLHYLACVQQLQAPPQGRLGRGVPKQTPRCTTAHKRRAKSQACAVQQFSCARSATRTSQSTYRADAVALDADPHGKSIGWSHSHYEYAVLALQARWTFTTERPNSREASGT